MAISKVYARELLGSVGGGSWNNIWKKMHLFMPFLRNIYIFTYLRQPREKCIIYLFNVFSFISDFSNSKISLKDCIYQLLTKPTDGILRRFSGRRWISFMIFDNLTGSSFLRNTNDLCSHADKPVEKTIKSPLIINFLVNARHFVRITFIRPRRIIQTNIYQPKLTNYH